MGRLSNYLLKGKRWLRQCIRRLSHYFAIEPLLKPFPASPEEVEDAEKEFFMDTIKEVKIIFYVGANIGQYSTFYSELIGKEGEVLCFEASYQTFQLQESECSMCRFNNLLLNHLTVSDQPGMVKLSIYEYEHSGCN